MVVEIISRNIWERNVSHSVALSCAAREEFCQSPCVPGFLPTETRTICWCITFFCAYKRYFYNRLRYKSSIWNHHYLSARTPFYVLRVGVKRFLFPFYPVRPHVIIYSIFFQKLALKRNSTMLILTLLTNFPSKLQFFITFYIYKISFST